MTAAAEWSPRSEALDDAQGMEVDLGVSQSLIAGSLDNAMQDWDEAFSDAGRTVCSSRPMSKSSKHGEMQPMPGAMPIKFEDFAKKGQSQDRCSQATTDLPEPHQEPAPEPSPPGTPNGVSPFAKCPPAFWDTLNSHFKVQKPVVPPPAPSAKADSATVMSVFNDSGVVLPLIHKADLKEVMRELDGQKWSDARVNRLFAAMGKKRGDEYVDLNAFLQWVMR